MTFLPILVRELRGRARSAATYWTRSAVALAGVVVCLPQLLGAGGGGTPASLGRYAFNGILAAAFLLSCFACLVTADAINSERREGTLGLLFLTRVKALDVLLGKLGSFGVSALCALVAFLPVLTLPILAGGVTLGEAFRKWLAVMATLFLSVAVGLYTSSVQEVRSKASLRAALLMLLFILIPAWLSQMYGGVARLSRTPWFALPSPLMTLLYGSDTAYRGAARAYWFSLAAVCALGSVVLLRARGVLLRGLRQGPAPAAPVAPPPVSSEQTLPPLPAWQSAGQIANPVERMVFRQRGIAAAVWTAALLSAVFQTGMIPFYSYGWRTMAVTLPWYVFAQVPFMAVSILTGALFAWVASRFFVEARRTGALELLLTTPEGAATIISGQWRALTRMLRWPVLLILAPVLLRVWLVLQGLTSASPFSSPFSLSRNFSVTPLYELLPLLLGSAATVLGLAALCWLGMWFGLRARGQAGAIAWTVGLAKGVPQLISILWSMLLMATTTLLGGTSPRTYRFLSWLPTVIIALGHICMILWAKRSLTARLADAEGTGLTVGQFCAGGLRDLAGAVRRVRRWTPP